MLLLISQLNLDANYDKGCRGYYVCQFVSTSNERIDYFDCNSNLLFDDILKLCNYQHLVDCNKNNLNVLIG